MGAFDHLEWTYNGAFEQLFGLGRGKFSKNFPKIQMPGGLPGGMFKLRFDWYIMFKVTSIPQTPQTNHSQYSSPAETLNLIVDSKSQPVEFENSTSELHVPSRRKKSLQSYCSVDFDFLYDL